MEKINHILNYYPSGNFLIQILTIFELNISPILVFWKDNLIQFKNGQITDAVVIDESIIELEILFSSGAMSYHYYEPASATSIKLNNCNSKILAIRDQNIIDLQDAQKQLWEDDNLELVFTTKKND